MPTGAPPSLQLDLFLRDKGSGQIRAKIYAKALRILPQRDGSKIRRVFHNELPSQLPSASALLRSAPGLLLGYTLSTNPL
jgi:hypothetical protein